MDVIKYVGLHIVFTAFCPLAFSQVSFTVPIKGATVMEYRFPVDQYVPTIQIDTDAAKADSSIEARLGLIDCESILSRWFAETGRINEQGQTLFSNGRDVALRMMKTSSEETKDLDKLFADRKESRELNRKLLHGADLRERALKQREHGYPINATKNAELPVLRTNEINSLIARYEEAERIAELKLVDGICEVVDPLQVSLIANSWIRSDYIYAPFAAKYLELNEDQVQQMRSDSIALRKLWSSMKAEPGIHNEELFKLKVGSEEYLRARYLQFSRLSPKQFRLVALRVSQGWAGCMSFAERLKMLEVEKINARVELDVLGDLYRTGVKLENTKQNDN